jgi:aryl-alcohol dehydrogenase-like predicted oxidoreductase
MASALDLAVAAWSPLGGGVLSGKYGRRASETKQPARFIDNPMAPAFVNDRNLTIAAEVEAVAKQLGRSPSQVALAWLRQRRGLVIPIVGARRVAQIEDNLGCLDFELSPPQVERLDQASRIELGFPHDFLASTFVRQMVYAGMHGSIVNHRR